MIQVKFTICFPIGRYFTKSIRVQAVPSIGWLTKICNFSFKVFEVGQDLDRYQGTFDATFPYEFVLLEPDDETGAPGEEELPTLFGKLLENGWKEKD